MGDAEAAIADGLDAVRLNPSDDLAWRSLALAYRAGQNSVNAGIAIDEAIARQRSDPTNLLLRASWLAESGERDPARLGLDEITLAWPSILAAPGWAELTSGIRNEDLMASALVRWRAGLPAPEPIVDQPLLLAAWSGRSDLYPLAAPQSGLSRALVDATVAIETCDPNALRVLAAASEADRRSPVYWRLRLQATTSTAAVEALADAVLRLYRLDLPTAEEAHMLLNPLAENDRRGFRPDAWGYRREGITWPSPDIRLPDPQAGAARLLLDPIEARRGVSRGCGAGG
jgi:hypothetical protein